MIDIFKIANNNSKKDSKTGIEQRILQPEEKVPEPVRRKNV